MSHRHPIDRVRAAVAQAEQAAGRCAGEVRLLAVSKTRSVREVRAAYAAGLTDFGENYAQEGVAKAEALAGLPITWHFIGRVQSNKTRDIARHFQWIHGVDRRRVAERLDAAAEQPLDVCVQVNVDGEPGKAGVPPCDAAPLVAEIARLPRLRLRGLMALPVPRRDPRPAFRRVRELFEELAPDAGPHWDTLSMGMSNDFAVAIAEGTTMVRIGTAIFGPRAAQTAPEDAIRTPAAG